MEERRQPVWRAVLEKLDGLRPSDEMDESFYDALRQSMLEACGTDADIDILAAILVSAVVEGTEAN